MSKKINIVFILPSLRAGGAERVISFVSQNLNKELFNCSLIVLGNSKEAVYEVKGIDLEFLNTGRLLKSIPTLFKAIKARKPDIVLGSISHVNRILTLYKLLLPKVKFIGREASLDGIITKYIDTSGFKYYKYYKNYFKYLNMVICQSQDMADNIKNRFNIADKKLCIINNPISKKVALRTTPINTNETRQLITIGRLSKEKGHLRIIEALAKLKIPFHYTIIGKGDEKETIFKQINLLNLQDKITYIEYTNEVEKYLKDSDLFLQGSFVEGFPNSLLESSSVGTPAVVFDAAGGTKEIITENLNGFTANNENHFLDCLEIALNKHNWQPKAIQDYTYEKFNSAKIIKQYESLFLKVLDCK